MSRALMLAILLAAGFPAAGQVPASDPPPSSTASEQKPQDAAPPSAQKEQDAQSQEKAKEEEKKKKGALGRLKDHVKDHFSTGCVGASTLGGCWGDGKDKKDKQDGQQEPGPDKNPAPPRSAENGDPDVSSSRNTQIDLSPPGQERLGRSKPKPSDDVQELQHYDPHAAEKDIEVGEYYLKSGNLKGALARFRSALYNKPNDAVATFRLAQALEKAGQLTEARGNYERYLQILPKGEFATQSTAALQRLPKSDAGDEDGAPSTSAPAETLPSKRSPQS